MTPGTAPGTKPPTWSVNNTIDHARYYTINETVQHRQFVELHHADEMMYKEKVHKFNKKEDDDAKETVQKSS